eukprot:scaffold110230_cov66-Phaeocystis_antarctica.AAC.9
MVHDGCLFQCVGHDGLADACASAIGAAAGQIVGHVGKAAIGEARVSWVDQGRAPVLVVAVAVLDAVLVISEYLDRRFLARLAALHAGVVVELRRMRGRAHEIAGGARDAPLVLRCAAPTHRLCCAVCN